MSRAGPLSSDPGGRRTDPHNPSHLPFDDGDDDDMDYSPPGDGDEDEDDNDDDDDDSEGLYYDANEDPNQFDIEVEFGDDTEGGDDDGNEEGDGDGDENGAGPRQPILITRDQIMQLLGHAGLGQLFALDYTARPRRRPDYFTDSDEDIGDDATGTSSGGPRKKRLRGRAAFEKVPSEEGRVLMTAGPFGTSSRSSDSIRRSKKVQYRIMQRELGVGGSGLQKTMNSLMKQKMIPGTAADTVVNYNARCYSGQFSDDGNFFFSCAQDFRVRMYDTSNPYDWKYYKTVLYPGGQWTITDASLSPDNRFLAYSSIRSIVCLAPTDPENQNDPNLLDFANLGRPGLRRSHYFGIWSVRFSGDGREIVAGTGDNSVYVYDIERGQSILRIPGHDDDVNAVCYGDSHSPHVLYSGSDDTTLKVWDRRSMGDGREAGVFLGHTEGLTYVDSKGDGRYVLSNAKDQTAKLWDLRKMMSKEKADEVDIHRYTTRFEYRSNAYPERDFRPHPYDCSLVTFRGHKVLKTLIRCHFSPPGSSDSRYVYSGSYDGSVYIWNMDATLAGKIDVLSATRKTRPRPMGARGWAGSYHDGHWLTCVRDASWHPNAPIIAATSWNGGGAAQGTCTVHTWNDGVDEDEAEPPVGRRVNARLSPEDMNAPDSETGSYTGGGNWFESDEESDEGSEYILGGGF